MPLRPFLRLASLIASIAFGIVPAAAMAVSPMHLEMTSAGKSARSKFTVTNTTSEPMPVEVTIKRLEIDEKGGASETKAGEEFLVFPPQVMIPPGASQTFRVQWVGEPELAASETYVLSVSQIPLKAKKAQSVVQVVMALGVLIGVAPPAGKPDMTLASSSVTTAKDGKHHPTLTIANFSNVHGLLQNATLHVSAGSWSKTYAPGEIAQRIGLGIVQPGKTRTFVLPDALPAGAGPLRVKLVYPGQ